MKYLLIVICLLSFQARAEIFICKDSEGKITYQQKPCLTMTTVGKLKNIPDVPIEEQILARNRINKANEIYHLNRIKAEMERQQQEEHERKLEAFEIERRKLELLERQTIAMERAAIAPRWSLGINGTQRPWWHPKKGSHGLERDLHKHSHKPRPYSVDPHKSSQTKIVEGNTFNKSITLQRFNHHQPKGKITINESN